MELMPVPKYINIELDNMFDEIESTTDTEFEVQGTTSEIEHKSYDGFIPFTNGGVQFTSSVNLDYLTSTSKGFLNKAVTNIIDETVEYCYTGAREQFIADNRAELEKTFCISYLDNNSERVNYHTLYEMNCASLAETLSEIEMSWLDCLLFIEHRAQFYQADNRHNETGENEICFLSGINTDYDYGRNKGLNITFEQTIKVGDLTPKTIKDIAKKMLASI